MYYLLDDSKHKFSQNSRNSARNDSIECHKSGRVIYICCIAHAKVNIRKL